MNSKFHEEWKAEVRDGILKDLEGKLFTGDFYIFIMDALDDACPVCGEGPVFVHGKHGTEETCQNCGAEWEIHTTYTRHIVKYGPEGAPWESSFK